MDNARHLDAPAQSMPVRPTVSTDNRLPTQFRLAARLIWVLVAAEMVGLTVAGAGPRLDQLAAQNDAQHALLASIGLSGGFATAILFGWAIVIFLAFSIPAVIIYLRRPDDWIAFVVSMTVLGVGCASTNFSDALRDAYAANLPWLGIPVDFIASVGEGLPVVALVVFPTGLPEPRWMRWVAYGMLGWIIARPFLYYTPYGPAHWSPAFLAVFLLVTMGSGLAAQIYRYRTVSTPAQRQQTKWIMLGSISGIGGLVVMKIILAIFPVLDTPGTTLYMVWRLVDYSVYCLCLLPFPFVFMISVQRYRLWDIDFLINRSLVYGSLTLLLAGAFGITLFAIQQFIRLLTGSGEIPTLGVVASAVMVGVVFQPARTGLRRFVDRRLYGIHIDYKRALGDEHARELAAQRNIDTKTSFGVYTDVQLIGRGGMGEVYRGIHPTLRRSVAIKLLPAAMAADDYARKRFLREAQTIARLRHPNIVSIQDYGESNGIPYMVMDFVDGMSLSDFMRQRGPLPLPEALVSLEDLAAALDYAHAEGIVHRDIKPSNVMLQPITQSQSNMHRLYRAVLMDFGIAKIVSDVTSRLTTTGMMGTIDYISPEQIQGAAEVTGRADIYSMGIMAYQMLTGTLPFIHNNPAAMLIAHLMEPVPDPKHKVSEIPDRACFAILRALSKKPEDRFATAGEFTAAMSA